MKIVIGVDGSANARAAAEFVRGMPWPPGSEALVLSAVEAATRAFIEWTGHGKLRHSRLLGVRTDRKPREVTWDRS